MNKIIKQTKKRAYGDNPVYALFFSKTHRSFNIKQSSDIQILLRITKAKRKTLSKAPDVEGGSFTYFILAVMT